MTIQGAWRYTMYVSRGDAVAQIQWSPRLEFDAGVLSYELRRSGLEALQKDWMRFAKEGYCTMNPVVGRWLLQELGHEVGPPQKQHTLQLDWMLRQLVPQKSDLVNRRHDAGADAQMTRLIYLALLQRLGRLKPAEPVGRCFDADAEQTQNKESAPIAAARATIVGQAATSAD